MNPFSIINQNLLPNGETLKVTDFINRVFYDINPHEEDVVVATIKVKDSIKLFTFSVLNILGGQCACCGYQFNDDDMVVNAYLVTFKEK